MNKFNLKKTFFAILMVSISSLSLAQQTTKITGVIRDAKTGEGLPFADVYFVGTSIGLTSDMDGNYSIETTEKVDSVAYLFLGYNKKQFKIKKGKTQAINVDLGEVQITTQMATVTTKRRRKRVKDTAAIALWRNIVKHRPQNSLTAAENYYFKDYVNIGFDWYNPNKKLLEGKMFDKKMGVMLDYLRTEENGNTYLPVLNKETIQEFGFRKTPRDKIERVLADKFSGMQNESMSDFIGSELDNVDPFKNVNSIAGKSFIGALSAAAYISYNFFLTDSMEREGEKYYQLTFVGKRKQDFVFLGSAWIEKSSYGVASIDMEISPHIAINHIQTMNISQHYSKLPEGYWVKDKDVMITTAKVDLIDIGTRKNKNKKDQVRIRRVLKRYDLKVNTTFEPNFFEGEEMQWDEQSNKRKEDYWTDNRPQKLDSISAGVYTMMDSVQKTPFYGIMDYLAYTGITAHLKAGPIEFGKVNEFVSWNSLEGVRAKLGVRTSKTLTDKFQLSGYAAYGFKDKDWKYRIQTITHLPSSNRRWHTLTAWYKDDFQALGQEDEMQTHDDLLGSLSRIGPMDKLMRIREAALYHEKDWAMGLYSKIGFRWREFQSVSDGFNFTQGEGATLVPSFRTAEVRAKLHWAYKERFWKNNSGFKRFSMSTIFPIIDLEYTGGIKGLLGGDHSYHKLDLSISHRWVLPLGYLDYKIKASKTFGDAPYPVMNVHLGNQSLMRNAEAFALMNDFEYVSDMYSSIGLDYYLDGMLFNSIPLIRKLKLRSVVTFKALYGTMTQSNREIYDIPSSVSAPHFYAEVGFGIENIFKMVRIDFMWRLTSLSNQANTRPFGINIGINPKF